MERDFNQNYFDVVNLRKQANDARQGATDQYTADVADFKNTQATEAEQGIASLPDFERMVFAPTSERPVSKNPYSRVFNSNKSASPGLPTTQPFGEPTRFDKPEPVINPYTGQVILNPYQPYESPVANPSEGYTPPMDPSVFGSTPGFEPPQPPPEPTRPSMPSLPLEPPVTPFPRPDFAVDPPRMNQGGGIPMGNNNILNSGLSRLPLNQQNDTLTQVFQSGFRPRR